MSQASVLILIIRNIQTLCATLKLLLQVIKNYYLLIEMSHLSVVFLEVNEGPRKVWCKMLKNPPVVLTMYVGRVQENYRMSSHIKELALGFTLTRTFLKCLLPSLNTLGASSLFSVLYFWMPQRENLSCELILLWSRQINARQPG